MKHVKEKILKDKRVHYTHTKYRYELEVPTELVRGDKKPKEFEFTSAKKGFDRFHTHTIKKLVEELDDAENELKDAMVPFLQAIFSRFHE